MITLFKQKALVISLRILFQKDLMYQKRWQKNVLSNPLRASDIAANIATAAASRNPKNVMKTLPELITFYDTGKGLYLGKFVKIFFDLVI